MLATCLRIVAAFCVLIFLLYSTGALVFVVGNFEPTPDLAFEEAELGSDTSPAEELAAWNRSQAALSLQRALGAGRVEQARLALERCDAEDAACLGLRGELYLTGGIGQRSVTKAMQYFQEGADRGDPDSQYALGVIYSNLVKAEPTASSISSSAPAAVPSVAYHRNESLAVLYLYAASMAGHPGALMAMGYRHSRGLGVPRSCSAAALNYIEVARRVAKVYSRGMPQAVELVRLGVESQERKAMSASEVSLFAELAAAGDAAVAAAVGKRYLLGIEGFRQSYRKALNLLQIAEKKGHATSKALLGYVHYLGLGVPNNTDLAYRFFSEAAQQSDAIGLNGLGYFYFNGLNGVPQDSALAFSYFNASAYGGNSDGMFNLASCYLSGTGVARSIQKANIWFTQALDRGHTTSAYALAVMYLNGVGTVRNCRTAVELLKRVCERGGWVAHKLQAAYEQRESLPERSAWYFLRLAEAGHEVSQMNVAHLLDVGESQLLLHPRRTEADDASSSSAPSSAEDPRQMGRIYAQRHYMLSAEQGSVLSDLRLGDYAYYGWGLRSDVDMLPAPALAAAEGSSGSSSSGDLPTGAPLADEDRLDMEAEELIARGGAAEVRFVPQEVDMILSLAHYKRSATTRITGDWMQPLVARATFNLGLMHHFGLGVAPSAVLARQFYARSLETDPDGVHAPVAMMRFLLTMQLFFSGADGQTLRLLAHALLADWRTHVVVLHLVALLVLFLALRRLLARGPGRPATAAAAEQRRLPSQAEGVADDVPAASRGAAA